MQNSDLVNILPYLMGGNKDMSGLLNAFSQANGGASSPPPVSPSPSASSQAAPQQPKYPDYNKLYPGGNQTPSSGGGGLGGMDMSTMMQLMAAMKSSSGGNQRPREPEIAPTATREIRASLQTILDLNALNTQQKPNAQKKE